MLRLRVLTVNPEELFSDSVQPRLSQVIKIGVISADNSANVRSLLNYVSLAHVAT